MDSDRDPMNVPPLRLLRPTDPPVPASRPRAPSDDGSSFRESPSELSAALESVVRRFGSFMRRTAHRHNLGADEVDEVMQETRIRLWKALGTPEKIEHAPASYVYRTVSSASLDFLRRRRARREESVEDASPAASARMATERAADHSLREEEMQQVISRAVELLVESRRAVLRMYLAGFEREEIQELLGWSEAKTRNLLYRGLADVRASLESWGYGPGGTP
jgi:RNA polymerase sigma-70 factor (ECF subfamily)